MTDDQHTHYFDSTIHYAIVEGSIQLQCACGEVRTFSPDAEDALEPRKPSVN